MDIDEERLSLGRVLLHRGSHLLVDQEEVHMEECLMCFQISIILAPCLKSHAWELGFAHYYNADYRAAAKVFGRCSEVDADDVEPYLWRCMAEAQVVGWEATQKTLVDFRGWDQRLCMMQMLELYQGDLTMEEVLQSSCGDCHAEARAMFACALYQEARGQEKEALSLLSKVIQAEQGGAYMRDLANAHYRVLKRRIRAKGVPRVTSKTGFMTPRIIKGGWQLAKGHSCMGDKTEEEARAAVLKDLKAHVEAGITAFDCGDIYTGVEELIGSFLQDHHPTHFCPIPVQVHTKFVPDLDLLPTIDETYVHGVIQRSLNRLGVDCLDLVQFHWWDYNIPCYVEIARILQQLGKEGIIRHLGLTNFDKRRTIELLEAGISITSNQVQVSLLDQRAVYTGLVAHAEKEGIAILAYGVLAGGLLTDTWLGKPLPASDSLANRSLVKYLLIMEEWGGWDAFQCLLRVLRQIADRHESTIAAIAIRYVLDIPGVTSVILGSRQPSHINASVAAATSLQLTALDRQEIEAAVASRSVPGDVYELERIVEGKHAKIMKYNLNRYGGPEHLEEVVERFLDGIFRRMPQEATKAGVHRYDHLLPHLCSMARNALSSWATRLLRELDAINEASLSPDQAVDRLLMKSHLHLLVLNQSRPGAQIADIASHLCEAVSPLVCGRDKGRGAQSLQQRGKSLACRLLNMPHILLRDMTADLRTIGPLLKELSIVASDAAMGLARYLKAQQGEGWDEMTREVEGLKVYTRAASLAAEIFASIVTNEGEDSDLDESGHSTRGFSGGGGGMGEKRGSFASGETDSSGEGKPYVVGVGRETMRKYVSLLHLHRVPGEKEGGVLKQGGGEGGGSQTDDSGKESDEVNDPTFCLDELDEVLQVAEKRFDAILEELEETAQRIDAQKSWQDMTEEMKKEHPKGSQLLDAYLVQINRVRDHIVKTGHIQLDPQIAVIRGVPTPEAMRPFLPFGEFFNPAPFSDDRRATLYLHPVADEDENSLRNHDRHWIEVIAVHESGHYHQSLIAQAHPRLLRRWFICPRFYEGWGLACEQLAYETSFYTEPLKARLTQLRLQLWRAARLILDLKLNCGMMTFEECCRFLQEKLMFSPGAAAGEAMIYVTRPGYAMSYLLGYDDIMTMREERKRQEGKAFDAAAFYRDLLQHGTIPPVHIRYLNSQQQQQGEKETAVSPLEGIEASEERQSD